MLIGITLFSIPIQPQAAEMLREIGITNNYIPFKSIISNIVEATHWTVWFKMIVGNVLLFMPLGFYLPLVAKKHMNVWKAVIIGFCVSLCIEVMQMLISLLINCRYRAFDVDDLLLNTAGTVLGLVIFKLLYYVLYDCLKRDISRYIQFKKS
jgi:glycopeptide antibiotics resistance protein